MGLVVWISKRCCWGALVELIRDREVGGIERLEPSNKEHSSKHIINHYYICHFTNSFFFCSYFKPLSELSHFKHQAFILLYHAASASQGRRDAFIKVLTISSSSSGGRGLHVGHIISSPLLWSSGKRLPTGFHVWTSDCVTKMWVYGLFWFRGEGGVEVDVPRLPQWADPNVENKGEKVYRTVQWHVVSCFFCLHALKFSFQALQKVHYLHSCTFSCVVNLFRMTHLVWCELVESFVNCCLQELKWNFSSSKNEKSPQTLKYVFSHQSSQMIQG